MCKNKKKYGNPLKEKARREEEQARRNARERTDRTYEPATSVLKGVETILRDGYRFVIYIEMGDDLYLRGCYDEEVAQEYHNTVAKAYDAANVRLGLKFGQSLLTNSGDPSGLVLPRHEIDKCMKNKSVHVKDNIYAMSFTGGRYDTAVIFYSKAA